MEKVPRLSQMQKWFTVSYAVVNNTRYDIKKLSVEFEGEKNKI